MLSSLVRSSSCSAQRSISLIARACKLAECFGNEARNPAFFLQEPGDVLSHVCREGSLEDVRFLLEDAEILRELFYENEFVRVHYPVMLRKDPHAYCKGALHEAIKKGDAAMVEFLISCGAGVNTVPVYAEEGRDESPLMLAMYHERLDIVRLLLENGADTDRKETVTGFGMMMEQEEVRVYCVFEEFVAHFPFCRSRMNCRRWELRTCWTTLPPRDC